MDGRIAEQLAGVGFKQLTVVDCIGEGKSNQHELNTSAAMRSFLGAERRVFPCTYLRFDGAFTDGAYESEDLTATYYDSRERQLNRSPEFRLVYPKASAIMQAAREGDWCWVLRREADDRLLVVVAEGGAPVALQLDRLLGTSLRTAEDPVGQRSFALGDLGRASDRDLSVEDADLLTVLGLSIEVRHGEALARVIERFGSQGSMPSTQDFATFTRQLCDTSTPVEDADRALHDWYAFSTEMFFGFEKHVLQPVLDRAFVGKPTIDIDTFFDLAKKHMNSRYSRAGYTFEHHLGAVFEAHGLVFTRMTKRLPDGSKPDFLFPGSGAYGDADVPDGLLTFLGAKTTTKERWMQVVAEAPRIRVRHLATMDRELNAEILNAMAHNDVVPVVPEPVLSECYDLSLASGMMNVQAFIEQTLDRQRELERSGIALG
ncbi:type II restriction endonuclease [Janibacter hoylei]